MALLLLLVGLATAHAGPISIPLQPVHSTPSFPLSTYSDNSSIPLINFRNVNPT